MAVREDLALIAKNCSKALTLLRLNNVTTVLLDPSADMEGETQITVTPAQRQQLVALYQSLITSIKTTAAGL